MGRATAVAGCVALAALGLVAAGCGSSSPKAASAPPTTTAAAPTTAGPRSAAFAAFQSCLKAHGITVPAFGGFRGRRPGTGTSPQPPARSSTPPATTTARPRGAFRQLTAKQQAAVTACRATLPAGTFAGGRRFGGGGPGGRNRSPAFAEYTACLKQHGVVFGSTSSSPTAFRKAQAACAKLLPATPGAPTTTG
jgi:hypothetical protein